jgi:hypothetical protein
MFQGLADSPTPEPASTVFFVYAVAFAENCILYAVTGALVWPVVHFIVRLRNRQHNSAKSST